MAGIQYVVSKDLLTEGTNHLFEMVVFNLKAMSIAFPKYSHCTVTLRLLVSYFRVVESVLLARKRKRDPLQADPILTLLI